MSRTVVRLAQVGSQVILFISSLMLPGQALSAGTIVRVDSSLGSFRLQLYDDQVPQTVAAFLSNIDSGLYQNTIIHFSSGSTQFGGRYFYNSCSEGPVPNSVSPPVMPDSAGLPNAFGTIAMVRDNDGNIQTEWMINIGDNSDTGDPSTIPIVFGEVINDGQDDGINIPLDISAEWKVAMDISPAVPVLRYFQFTVNCGSFNRDNMIFTQMHVESVNTSNPPVYFDESTGLLTAKVDLGESGFIELSFVISSTDPNVVIQALPDTVSTLSGTTDNIATFDALTGELFIPELSVGNAVAFRDVRFLLTDLDNLLFTLQSFANP